MPPKHFSAERKDDILANFGIRHAGWVVGTVAAYGARPVSASTLNVVETITLSGHRPVTANTMELTTSDWLPSNRPMGSNDLGEDSNLMGYLD